MVFGPLFYFMTDERSRSILAVLAILFLAMQSEICFFLPSFLYKAVKDKIKSTRRTQSESKKKSSSSMNTAQAAAVPLGPPPKPISHAIPSDLDNEKTEESQVEGRKGGGEEVTEPSES